MVVPFSLPGRTKVRLAVPYITPSHVLGWSSGSGLKSNYYNARLRLMLSRVKRLAHSHALLQAPREIASSARTRETSRYITHSRPVSRDEDQEI